MKLPVYFTLALLMLCSIPVRARTDSAGGKSSAEKYRLTSGSALYKGTLVSSDSDGITLALFNPSEERTFSHQDISKMERFAGRRSHWKTGALIGAGAGIVFTTVMFIADEANNDPVDDFIDSAMGWDSPGFKIFMGAIMGTAGALVGSLVGLAIQTDRWEETPLIGNPDRNVDLGFIPARDGGYLTLSLSF